MPEQSAPELSGNAPETPVEDAPEMSGRTMVLLGGIMSVAVVCVFGLTLLVGGTSSDPGSSPAGGQTEAPAGGQEPPVTSAPSGAATGAPVSLPAVTGLGTTAAIERLASRKIPLGAVIRVPSSQDPGRVVRSYPPSGTTLRAGAPVTLYVSAGQGGAITGREVAVPYFIGLSEQQARSTAAMLGFQITVASSGTVVTAQQPRPGAVYLRGSTITLTLG